jgi:hypothetical protein
LDHIEEFVTSVRALPNRLRVLAIVLFTDNVCSTEQAGQLDDRRERKLPVRLARGRLKI